MTLTPPKEKKGQLPFEPRLFAHARFSISPTEAAVALGITNQQIRDLISAGNLRGVGISDAPNPQRQHIRLDRNSVLAFWLERYLKANGEEYPWPNTPEVAMYRQQIRAAGHGAPQDSVPSC